MTPARGFATAEFEKRLARAQSGLKANGADALLLTTPAEFYYFTGFLTRFWESPTRPWYLFIPAEGKPIAVIPAIGEPLMSSCFVGDILTWPSPAPDGDGTPLLAEVIKDRAFGTIATPDGAETHMRMPLSNFRGLEDLMAPAQIVSDQGLVAHMRATKSAAEIEKIEHACAIASRAFARVGEIATEGVPLSTVFRKFQMLCLEEGGDHVSFLAGGASQNGYGDIIASATDAPLAKGDVLMLDTGVVWDGYFCDFDRNFSVGQPNGLVRDAHARLIETTQTAFGKLKPGVKANAIFDVMWDVLDPPPFRCAGGRLGHGLGLQLTEGFSFLPHDETPLGENTVLTLEPGLMTSDGMLVHEENVVITNDGARYLSTPAKAEIEVI